MLQSGQMLCRGPVGSGFISIVDVWPGPVCVQTPRPLGDSIRYGALSGGGSQSRFDGRQVIGLGLCWHVGTRKKEKQGKQEDSTIEQHGLLSWSTSLDVEIFRSVHYPHSLNRMDCVADE